MPVVLPSILFRVIGSLTPRLNHSSPLPDAPAMTHAWYVNTQVNLLDCKSTPLGLWVPLTSSNATHRCVALRSHEILVPDGHTRYKWQEYDTARPSRVHKSLSLPCSRTGRHDILLHHAPYTCMILYCSRPCIRICNLRWSVWSAVTRVSMRLTRTTRVRYIAVFVLFSLYLSSTSIHVIALLLILVWIISSMEDVMFFFFFHN